MERKAMERKDVTLYGARSGALSIDLLEHIGPNGAGLLLFTVDYQGGADPLAFALDPGGAGRVQSVIGRARELSNLARMARCETSPVDVEYETLVRWGLPIGPLNAAREAGLLQVIPGSHVEQTRMQAARGHLRTVRG